MDKATQQILQQLQKRSDEGLLRRLVPENSLADFCSNDYLGFARDANLSRDVLAACEKTGAKSGSTGSRLLTGNSQLAEDLETDLAGFFKSGSALLFNSGYDANIGLLSSLPQRGDTVITDELVHASIIDGVRLSHANRFIFRHNDLDSLNDKLSRATGTCYVVVESVYSMDGDVAPLNELLLLVKNHGAHLIVDEAHAVGLWKNGLCAALNLEKEVFARVVTFGKALGSHGAAVLGSVHLRDYLINFARSFIYTTAQSPHTLLTTKFALEKLAGADDQIGQLQNNIKFFTTKSASMKGCSPKQTAIQQVIIPGNGPVRKAAGQLQQQGFDVRPIVSPTVAAGAERLRICLHSFNTQKEIGELVDAIVQTQNT